MFKSQLIDACGWLLLYLLGILSTIIIFWKALVTTSLMETTEGVEHFSDDNSGRIDSGKQAQQWNMALFYITFLFNHVIFHCPVK